MIVLSRVGDRIVRAGGFDFSDGGAVLDVGFSLGFQDLWLGSAAPRDVDRRGPCSGVGYV